MANTNHKMSHDALEYVQHHAFLPPKLPQKDDYSPELDSSLLKLVIDALEDYKDVARIGNAVGMLQNIQRVHSAGNVVEAELKNARSNLLIGGKRYFIIQMRSH